MKQNKKGIPLVPAGSCRDLFLHFTEESKGQALQILSKHLNGIAECYDVEDLIRAGFFGSSRVSQTFLDRVGNVVILPFEKQSVWWYERGKFEQNFYGSHGGLTPGEMDSIFLFAEI